MTTPIPSSGSSSYPQPPAQTVDPVRKSRKILPYDSNLTPSVKADSHELNPDDVVQHAYQRVLCAYVTLLAIHNTGRNSAGPLKRLKVQVDHADMQGGKGSGGRHAAHSSMTAGFQDNRRELIIDEISENKELSPIKTKILKTKGFSEKDLEKIIAHSEDVEIIKAIFKRVWNQPSIIHGTRLYQRLQLTFELPSELNLQCDGRLEKAKRSEVAALYETCMKGEVKPEDACDQIVETIQGHFSQSIVDLTNKIELLTGFQKQLTLYHKAAPEKAAKILEELQLTRKQLYQHSVGAPFPRMPKVCEFLRDPKKQSKEMQKELREELTHQKDKYERLLNYCNLELEGTTYPEYAAIAGEIPPGSQAPSLLSTPEKSPLKHRMLQPVTPIKKKACKKLF